MHPRQIARTYPDRPAVIMVDPQDVTSKLVLSYGELSDATDCFVNFFQDKGLEAGDTIALCIENCPEIFVICWAAFNCGLYFVPISTRLKNSEIAHIVSDSGARVFVGSTSMSEEIKDFPESLSGVDSWLVLGKGLSGYQTYTSVLTSYSGQAVKPDAPVQGAAMMYTSGTTGFPKGVKAPISALSVSEPPPLLALLGRLYDFDGETVYLSTGPLYHAAPLKFNMAVQTLGGTCVVLKKFDAQSALMAIDEYKVSHSQWVPTMFTRLQRLPDEIKVRYDLSSHRVAIHAAAPCPVELKHNMLAWWGNIIHEYYAGSESVGMCAINSEQWLAHIGSVGRAVKGDVHVLDANDENVPVGETGLIFFANGGEFAYHNDVEKTARSHNSKGWATFGDIGHLDEDGYLYLTDRRDYVIISGGVNIYPQESEDVLSQHPEVDDVAVFGIPNEEFGEEVKAVVQTVDPEKATPELAIELLEYCWSKLAKLKCPRSIDFTEIMPREPTGKLLKRKLQQQYRETA